MRKRKNGQEIIDVPQPKWPELAYFDGDKMHRIVPVVALDGSATYDCSKPGAKAEALVDQSLARLPALERDTAIVKKAAK